MHRRFGFIAGVVWLLASFGPSAVGAQEAPSPVPPKAGPEVVAQAEIAIRADVDGRFARDVIQRAKGRDPTELLEPRLQTLDESVRKQSELFKRDDLELLPVIRLESLERHWNFYRKQFDAWRDDLKQATAQYSEDAGELAKRRANWELTREAAAVGGMAPALANRVRSVLAELSLAEQAVSGPLEKQIRLSRRGNAVEASITA